MSSQKVEDQKVVSISYMLKDAEGTEIDSTDANEPLVYLQGSGQIVPGLEKQLVGKVVGDRILAVVAPEDGYGPKSNEEPIEVPRGRFPPRAKIEEGMSFAMSGPDGEHIPVWVTKTTATSVFITPEHPLAGVTLHFDVQILSIRDATAEELQHGHAHGAHGHHHH